MSRPKKPKGADRPEIWSFFTGAMGLDLGFEAIGLHATLANEIHDTYCETIKRNRPELCLVHEDISELSADRLRSERDFDGDVHLMIGGPPCQSFSSGGKRAALSDPRGNLIYEYLRLISEVRPRYFVLENVANLLTAALLHRPIAERPGRRWSLKSYAEKNVDEGDGAAPLSEDELAGSALKRLLEDVDKLGYAVSFGVLDSADFGAPQHRMRFVIIASREDGRLPLPSPTHGAGRLPFLTVRDAIEALIDDPGEHSEYTPAMRRFFEMVPEGGNWRSLPEALHREALGGAFASGGGKTGFFRRLSWDAPAPTITGRANRKGSAMCHPSQIRPISVRECAALQGFPADWVFSGSMNAKYMQIGNAVPTKLGEAIGRAIASPRQDRGTCFEPSHSQHAMLEAALKKLRSAARNKRSRQPTVSGHRSMGGMRRVEPNLIVLVGQSAFHVLTRSHWCRASLAPLPERVPTCAEGDRLQHRRDGPRDLRSLPPACQRGWRRLLGNALASSHQRRSRTARQPDLPKRSKVAPSARHRPCGCAGRSLSAPMT